ncbi:MAG: AI-2E family transporter [Patescibacteria group bacterium]|jgi:predicted PurR-regulated permease PerM
MEKQNQSVNVNLSSATIVKLLIITFSLWFLYIVRDVMLILLVSVILASAFNPWVSWFHARRIPRVLGVLIIYLVLFGFISLTIGLLIPPITEQIQQISHNFPQYFDRITSDFQHFKDFSITGGLLGNIDKTLESFQVNVSQTTSNLFSSVVSIFGGFFAFIGVVVITFYMLVEENAIKRFLRSISPEKYQPYLNHLANRIQEKISQWLRGQIVLSLIIGVMSWLGLFILGIDYALVLGLWAGLTEAIPYLGPFLGAIPAVFIAFTDSPIKALLVVILYVVIQQLENHLIVPRVMSKAVGLNPLIIIIVMLVGAKVAGLIGILLAVPVTLIIEVFVKDVIQSKTEDDRDTGSLARKEP